MITFCQMTMNRELETMHCLQKYLPYVDRAVVIDGGSTDNTIISLRNWAQDEPKLQFFLYPWKDNFSAQRSNYLKHVPDDTWALVSDPDEWFDQELLEALPKLVATAEANGKDMVGFQCRSVSMKGPRRVHENMDNYWKRLLFKKYPGTVYGGNPHEHLVNHPHQIMDTKFVYEHVKQQNVTWPRGCFVPGTKVFTPNECKNIEEISVGDLVLDMDANPKRVTEVMKREVSEEIFRIKLPGSPDILCTKEHPWYVAQGENCCARGKTSLAYPRIESSNCKCCEPDLDYPDTEFSWKVAEELNELSVMRFPRPRFSNKSRELIYPVDSCMNTNRVDGGNQYTGIIPKRIHMSPELAFLSGLYLAEGHLEKTGETRDRVCFSMHEKEKDTWGAELAGIIKQKFDRSSWYTKTDTDSLGCILETQVKGLGGWLQEHFSSLSFNKKLPYYFVTGCTLTELRELIRGVFTGDASMNSGLTISLTSPHLIMGIYLSLCRLGYRPSWNFLSLETLNNSNSGIQHKHPMYRINILKAEQGKFRREILKQDSQDEKLESSFARWVSPNSVKSGISSITKEHYTGMVYNIEVEDTHSYLVPGATSHNCRNMFIGGGGPNGQHAHLSEWKRLRKISSDLGLNTFEQFDKYLLAGEIAPELKQWMIDHMLDEGWDGASEFRETYKTFYRIYHPELEPDEFRQTHIP